MATNRFICEVCNKGFQREQNLQLHRRGHNLPWKLKQKNTKEQAKRKVYLCPEPTCVHHDPSRALGDLTGIKKHFSRKHGEKKWKCEKCSKKYAVQSDWKAHSKTCGTREYRCDCGTLFSRRDSFITHRAFCDALAHESARHPSNLNPLGTHLYGTNHMSLGLSQVGTQLQNQNSILTLGNAAAGAPKFEHLISPFQQSSFAHSSSPQSLSSSSPFFMADPNQGIQDLQSHHHQGQFSNKQLHGLMQLPDFQGPTTNNTSTSAPSSVSANSAANFFNLSFFPNSNSNDSTIPDQFNSITAGTTLYTNSPGSSNHHQVGSALSSIFGNSSLQQENNMPPHMSATALLQKASQMGLSTTTINNGSSLLRRMESSSTNGSESELNNFAATFGSDHSKGEGIRSSMENDHQHHLHGIMNSLANRNNNSMFGHVKGNENNNVSHFHIMEEAKRLSSQNLGGVCFGGSDKLTLDFLGVNGGIVRNMSGGFSQREQLDSILDPKLESTQANQQFGSSSLQ
ncbi:protein indeterminate-domain 5, chloroplastic-like isoform X2 [Lotus japonicus]|nr:protein indeterminate-domain 5, chloroplastic-like isoform X2 [Lotus japonicus]